MEVKTWGMRFNQYPEYKHLSKGQRPQWCPDWLETRQISTWQEQGLVLWDNVDKCIEVLQGGEALRLLSDLHSQDNWKSQGISVTRLIHKIEFQLPEAGPELMELLEEKKPILFDMAEKEKKRWEEAVRQSWGFAFGSFHKQEQSELGFTNRPFAWRSHIPYQWVCQYQSAEGQVCLEKSKCLWYIRVTRPGHTGKSHCFVKLVEAVEWTEKEIVELANQPEGLSQHLSFYGKSKSRQTASGYGKNCSVLGSEPTPQPWNPSKLPIG